MVITGLHCTVDGLLHSRMLQVRYQVRKGTILLIFLVGGGLIRMKRKWYMVVNITNEIAK